jgi:UDP-N-acetylglucosamine--N-acetylmuramyl-(pentapeptide) pyrophosphoryl-undecaprenol N-acetylglucosamine transferase
VLVPFPQAADDHQRKNAEAFVAAGAAVMIIESELTEDRLLTILVELLKNDSERVVMGIRARSLAHPRAVAAIGEMVAGLRRS